MEKTGCDNSNLRPPAEQAINHWLLQTLLGLRKGLISCPSQPYGPPDGIIGASWGGEQGSLTPREG